MILAAASIQNPEYVPTNYQVSAERRPENDMTLLEDRQCANRKVRPSS